MPKKKKLTIAETVFLAFLLCVGIYQFSVYQKKLKTFNTAAQLFEAGNYMEAEKAFKSLQTFRNSENLVVISDVFNHLGQENYDIASKLSDYITDYSTSDDELQKAIDDVRDNHYVTAQSLISEENYKHATQIYRCLGDYKDAAQLALYYEGIQEEVDGNLEQAVTLFDQIKDFKDASDHKDLCSTYLKAVELQKKGDEASLQQAAELFSQLGDFQDSGKRVLQCKSVTLFRDAKAYADAKKYKKAYKILNKYPKNPYKGWKELLAECSNQITYQDAKKQYNSGHFYKAHMIYESLGNFKDSEELAEKCKRDLPNKSILYQNPNYNSSSAAELSINNPGAKNTYIKLYTSEGELVARIFIRKYQKASINLPGGTYHLNRAYGDDWYDERDLFGDKGSYLKYMVKGNYDFTLNRRDKLILDQEGNDSTTSVDFGSF